METDISLREQETHGEAEQVRRSLRIRQPNRTATINLLVLRVVPRIHYDAICYSSAAVVDLQSRRSVSIGVIGLRIDLREHPLTEFSEFVKVSAKAWFAGE